MGYFGTIVGTLENGASSYMMCTLGGGVRIGGGVDLSAGAISGVGGFVSGTAALNKLASWRMLRICAFPNKRNGDAGVGFSTASTNILATSEAFLAEEAVVVMMS